MTIVKCGTCSGAIIWAKTRRKNRTIPMDAEPSMDGRFRLYQESGETVWAEYVPDDEVEADEIGKLHVSHFATCPDAGLHRKARA